MRTIKLFTVLVIFVFLTVSTCFAADNEIILNYNFKQPVVGEVNIDSTVYNTVTISGLPNPGKAAIPSLPVKGAKVYIPDGKKFVSASVVWGNPQEIRLTHLIAPAQKQYPLSQKQNLLPTSPDQAIYSADALYPVADVNLLSQQGMCGYRIAILNLFPVRYNPVANTLTYYPNAQLVVTLADVVAKPSTNTTPISKRSNPDDLNRVLNFVDNKEDVPKTLPQKKSGPTPLLGLDGPYDYVIITNQYLAGTPGPNNLQALRDYRINHDGMTAIVVLVDDPNTLKSIYANYPVNPQDLPPIGVPDNQYEIRRFIQDAYARWGTKYVLLAGDADGDYIGGETEEPIVPVRQLYDPYVEFYYDNGLASDLYYACLDGSYDNNANGFYGEYDDGEDEGEVDLIAEVYVGRAPADSRTEISNFVRKTLDYEAKKIARDPYLYNTQQAGEALGAVGYAYSPYDWGLNIAKAYCNEIKKGSAKWYYSTNGFEDRLDTNSTLYDVEYVDSNNIRRCSDCWPVSDLIDRINTGINFINGNGHGDVDRLMKMSNSDADSLTNAKYFIGASVACYPGSFDNRDTMGPQFDPYDPGCNCTLAHDSIAEHLVMGSNGAVALVANSRYGWGSPWSTDGSTHIILRNFWDAIFGKQIFSLAKANQYSKEEAVPFSFGDYMRWSAFQANLIGDPALEVFLPTRLVPQSYPTIQAAISAAVDGDTIVVSPGTYTMTKAYDIDINKNIKLKSASGPTSTIIDCNNYTGCIKFSSVNNASLEGFTIKNSSNGGDTFAVTMSDSNAVAIKNNIFQACLDTISLKGCALPTIVNNTIPYSLHAMYLRWSDTGTNTVGGTIENNIIGGLDVFSGKITKDANVIFTGSLNYNNVYGHRPGEGLIPGFYSAGLNPGSSSISEEPNFVDTTIGNYHLNSLNSLCVDAGNPSTFYDKEPYPNGYKINMGAYGNTFEAEATLNHKPMLNTIGNKSINFGNNLQFTVSGSDVDSDTITFSYSPAITGASLNNTTGVFSWIPTSSQVGTYQIKFRASDAHGMLSDSQTITIVVTDPNEPPPPPPPPCRPCGPYERKKGICVPCYVQ